MSYFNPSLEAEKSMTARNLDPNGVTVLKAFEHKTVKEFVLNDQGQVKAVPYGHERYFTCWTYSLKNIQDLFKVVNYCSHFRNLILIRGQLKFNKTGPYRRNKDNFQEPDEGLSWAMLDFDNIPLPDDICPTSLQAMEYVITKLPEPFHNASYIYQFSSSSGIVQPDGTPLKTGLNVHLFFWFDRPIKGVMLGAYLKGHCIRDNFLERVLNRADVPTIRYGVDLSLFRPVQPHYIAAPIIGEGVICTLDERQRQDLITKSCHFVALPELDNDLLQCVEIVHRRILDEYKRACGWIQDKALTISEEGKIALHHYYRYRNPNPAVIRAGRLLKDVQIKELRDSNGQVVFYAILYFQDEGSPGSWYVSSRHPCFARRFGDYAEVALKELSEEAYYHIRDSLGWFRDIELQTTLSLTDQGYLPPFSDFVKARNNVILAPTGSGKTTAFCEYAKINYQEIIIYAAQTIALTQQMKDDLRANGVMVTHYQDFNKIDQVRPGIYVTTNESLHKFLDWVVKAGRNFILVIDEIHIALDDFMSSNKKNKILENAITRAKRTIFMTATLTPLQLKKLTETILITTGELTRDNFGYYEFSPAKTNPLVWRNDINFGGDFVRLLRHYQKLLEKSEVIPRTIIIAPTSKMKLFQLLLTEFKLIDHADIVSRTEATQDEIEAARVSNKPILISSPLFSLGLNFQCPPARFWTYFGHLKVDTSQIIQTLNRANRTSLPCEVRLYAGTLESDPYKIPAFLEEKLKMEGYFRGESSFQGALDAHFQLDRVTYNQLRTCEKVTGKALFELKENDSIQNYQIVENWKNPWPGTKEDAECFTRSKKEAKISYKNDITQYYTHFKNESWPFLTYFLGKLKEESRNFSNDSNKLIKDIEDKEKAIAMCLSRCSEVGFVGKIMTRRLVTLYGDITVYMSAQFNWEVHPEWMKVASEKTKELAKIFSYLKDLKEGRLDGITFARKMRFSDLNRAILALATSEKDFVSLYRMLEKLDSLYEEYRERAGKSRRESIDDTAFTIAKDFLETIGIWFDITESKKNGRKCSDPKLPIVPNWNFAEMERVLLIKAESLKHMPVEPINYVLEDLKWGSAHVSRELCQNCVHCSPSFFCSKGRPIYTLGYSDEAITECDAFKELPQRLRRMD